ncbi:WD repeat protein Rrb1 [Capsaspora owczarzaki ATCC 30864]|uniref:Glutamate-rich WD repeat-containing protein 1 n=1 Tax=Capsaspora owczarzaki (strain ATCC 30864) TaxID=595528 RepID=A0A0D2WXG7_CAPO3|nr:WD repeat protein Rrb1 [Capsaspora owczarzaki ATCC 30864]KJE97885.1 WD repeat protein Rrb1 [Capsaspora owczarzaki ATCC 30864]|eukprot:XP_004343052.1 WD repeat protein Rrb1 [Capsaspora owczarzaki ATCC 30864]
MSGAKRRTNESDDGSHAADEQHYSSLNPMADPAAHDPTAEMGEFEDMWEDEEEENVIEEQEQHHGGNMMETDDGDDDEDGMALQQDEDEDEDDNRLPEVYLPGAPLEEGEVLEVDNSAYDMLHMVNVEWPCLSFDIIEQPIAEGASLKFPLTAYAIAGTQAERQPRDRQDPNKLVLLKMAQLRRTIRDDEEEEADIDDADSDTEDDPVLDSRTIPHDGVVNRLRVAPQHNNIVCTWSSNRKVHIWNVATQLSSFDSAVDPEALAAPVAPLFTFSRHTDEGYSIDWSPLVAGRMVSGDCDRNIFLWNPLPSGTWKVEDKPFRGHTASVEDLQWSPAEQTVLASCSVDRTVKIWDTRNKGTAALSINAHNSDVNVISWSRLVQYLIVSGDDEGGFKIWDLRSPAQPAAEFKWHTQAITSVEWHPSDESVLAVAGADDQVTLWDLSVERDNAQAVEEIQSVPAQLLFIHQGQQELREVHWHKQHPGVLMSTAGSGINVFKTISV